LQENSCCCGDDDSGTYGGQLFMYVSNTVGDLANGSLYMMKRTNDNQRKKMVVGESYPVSFIKIENHTTMTGNQINTSSKYIEKQLSLVVAEDLDYRRQQRLIEIYFNVTGQNTTGNNADASRTSTEEFTN
jgi:hypothetical protein